MEVSNTLNYEIEKIKQNDYTSYQSFYDQTVNILYGFIWKKINDKDTAEKLLNELYGEIYARISIELDDNSHFFYWAGNLAEGLAEAYIDKNVINEGKDTYVDGEKDNYTTKACKSIGVKITICIVIVALAFVCGIGVYTVKIKEQNKNVKFKESEEKAEFTVEEAESTTELITESTTELITESTTELETIAEGDDNIKEKYYIDEYLYFFSNGYGYAICTNSMNQSVGVLFNNNLEAVYTYYDLWQFDNRGLVMLNDKIAFKTTNGGFEVVGRDGDILYCYVPDDGITIEQVNVTKDNKIAYIKKTEATMSEESDMYFVLLDEKYNIVDEIKIDEVENLIYDYRINMIYYFDDSIYIISLVPKYTSRNCLVTINLDKKQEILAGGSLFVDADLCVGVVCSDKEKWESEVGVINFDGKNRIKDDRTYAWLMCNHKMFGVSDEGNGDNTDGVSYDFDAEVDDLIKSSDGKYYGYMIKGKDYKNYIAVVDSNGKLMYEPVMCGSSNSDVFYEYTILDGYLFLTHSSGYGQDYSINGYEIYDCNGNQWEPGQEFIRKSDTFCADYNEYLKSKFIVTDKYYYIYKYGIYKLDGTKVEYIQ